MICYPVGAILLNNMNVRLKKFLLFNNDDEHGKTWVVKTSLVVFEAIC